MKDLLILVFFHVICFSVTGQEIITGIVTDKDEMPIIGANVYIEGTYDGGITDLDGSFSFKTSETEEVTLQISYLGYELQDLTARPAELHSLDIKLKESAMTLDAVEITGSTFKADGTSKVAALKPLDILTTAGSMGDVIAAVQTLPGTQTNAEDGRLFVRGGDARETAIYIDGMRVFSPYSKTIGGTPTRGRYSPLLFKGVSFSTGGYSSLFGQALSGVLDMQSIDEPDETMTNINLMTVGLGVGHTQKWSNQSLSVNTQYINLSPYDYIQPSRIDWKEPFAGFSGEAIYRLKTNKGLFKTYVAVDQSGFELNQYDFNTESNQLVDLENDNIYANTTYKSILDEKTSIHAGFSLGINNDQTLVDNNYYIENALQGYHARAGAKTIFNDRLIADYGIERIHQGDDLNQGLIENLNSNKLSRNTTSAYVESDYFFNKNLAVKTGLRVEYSDLLSSTALLPRMSIAQKLSKHDQISASYGWYNQDAEVSNLFINSRLDQERANHYILNFSRKTDKQILRLDTYYKKYNELARFTNTNGEIAAVDNSGDGYAYGMDLFYRANQVLENLDMWVSYSWLNNKRVYKDFPIAAPTKFSSTHNLSLVGKYFISSWRSQLSLTYVMASGRPYDDPNTPDFMTSRSKYFNSLNLSWAYLISNQKILFVSINNATNFKNSYGYEFKREPNTVGVFESRLVRPNDDQFFFVGFFITMSKNKLNNQLNNL